MSSSSILLLLILRLFVSFQLKFQIKLLQDLSSKFQKKKKLLKTKLSWKKLILNNINYYLDLIKLRFRF